VLLTLSIVRVIGDPKVINLSGVKGGSEEGSPKLT